MTYGVSNGHVTDDVTWPQRCCQAVWSAILATAWLLVYIHFMYSKIMCTVAVTSLGLTWFDPFLRQNICAQKHTFSLPATLTFNL